jgi:hypothetical protein
MDLMGIVGTPMLSVRLTLAGAGLINAAASSPSSSGGVRFRSNQLSR